MTPVAAESLFWATVIWLSSSGGVFSWDVRSAEGRAGRERQEGGEQAQVAWGAQLVGFPSVLVCLALQVP